MFARTHIGCPFVIGPGNTVVKQYCSHFFLPPPAGNTKAQPALSHVIWSLAKISRELYFIPEYIMTNDNNHLYHVIPPFTGCRGGPVAGWVTVAWSCKGSES